MVSDVAVAQVNWIAGHAETTAATAAAAGCRRLRRRRSLCDPGFAAGMMAAGDELVTVNVGGT